MNIFPEPKIVSYGENIKKINNKDLQPWKFRPRINKTDCQMEQINDTCLESVTPPSETGIVQSLLWMLLKTSMNWKNIKHNVIMI